MYLVNNMLFIEAPRTASTAITSWLARHVGANEFPNPEFRHDTASQIRVRLGEERFAAARKFAVERDPVDVICGMYQHTMQAYDGWKAANFFAAGCTAGWIGEMARVANYQSIDVYAMREWLTGARCPKGSMLRHWATLAGADCGVRRLRYSHIEKDFAAMCAEWSLPAEPLLVENHTGAANDVRMGAETQQLIREFFAD